MLLERGLPEEGPCLYLYTPPYSLPAPVTAPVSEALDLVIFYSRQKKIRKKGQVKNVQWFHQVPPKAPNYPPPKWL